MQILLELRFFAMIDFARFNSLIAISKNFESPKHGAVIQITEGELHRLENQWHFSL